MPWNFYITPENYWNQKLTTDLYLNNTRNSTSADQELFKIVHLIKKV